MTMTKEEIKTILPHREPMLLIDSAYLDEEGLAHGEYTVKGDEWFLQGHFPGNPVVPGVIQCEMAGQTCCVLLADEMKGKTPYFTGINKVKFKKPVKPGDKIEFVCRLIGKTGIFSFVEGKAFVDGKLCMSGEFSFALVNGGA